jgi:hypothetical protein
MALEVKEEVSAVIFYKNVNGIDAEEAAAPALAFQPVSSAMSPDSIMVDIEGIHSILTRNFTLYTAECLKKSVPYWTTPYERPVIMHHNTTEGVQVGRIKAVEFLEESRAKAPGLLFTCNIGDEAGIKGVKNGTLSTVSIGAVIHKATCSICGQNIAAEGECEHKRGVKYEDKLCYWIMEDMEPKELSYVIVPSDRYANTIKIYKPKDISAKESYNEGGNEEMGIFDNIDLPLTEPEAKEAEGTEKEQKKEKQKEIKEPETKAPEVEEPEIKAPEVEEPKEEENKEEQQEENKEQQQEEQQEDKEEENKEAKIENMSREELIDKCKDLMKKMEGLRGDVDYLRKRLNQERGFKEALELEVLELKQIQKMHLVEQVVDLRKELGLKEENVNDLMMLSEESLNSSIKTYMEFKESNTFNVNTLPKIESAALVDEEADNTIKESAKEDLNKNNSNIDYEQQLNNWLKNMTNKKFF